LVIDLIINLPIPLIKRGLKKKMNNILLDLLTFTSVQEIFTCLVPIMIYSNVETDKSKIIFDNKNKSGIYRWVNTLTGETYIGSSTNLANRFKDYFSQKNIERILERSESRILRAIQTYGYSKFSINILEYCDSTETIIREQYYIDLFSPEYNILKITGNSLGYKHTEEAKAKISKIHLGKIVSTETLTKMSLALSEKNNPMFGRKHSEETLALMSEAFSGVNNPMFGRTHSAEILAKMSTAQGTNIYVYSSDKSTLINTFSSANKAAEFFNCHYQTVLKYAKNGGIFKNQWFLSTTLISLDKKS
jgi:group I intron endonuclease